MSNHAYESAAALRPQRCTPTALNDLAECFALDASRIDPSRLSEILVTGASVDSGDVAAGELFTALPGFKRHGALFAAEAADSGAMGTAAPTYGSCDLSVAGIRLIATRRHRVARKRTKPQLASKLSPLDATEWHKDGALDATEWHALPRTPANPIPNPVTVGVSRCRRTIGMSNNRGALMGR